MKENEHIKIIKELALSKKRKVYLVGGFVRDFLLGKTKLDYDFAVKKDALALARSFSRKVKGAYVLLDKERGCARVCKKTTGGIATYDFADFRAGTFKGDLSHRDFTINTFSININALREEDELSDAIIDEKEGMRDLKNRKIRMVGTKAFKEDPLRILRAYSLRAQLDFSIERRTRQQMKKDSLPLREVSAERVRDELFKILATNRAGKILKEMSRDDLLEIIIPQVRIMHDCHQGTYHHLDVWPHSLETVCQLDNLLEELKGNEDLEEYLNEPMAGERKRYQLMKLAALLHDIGKPETRLRKDGRISFHGHEHVGKRIVRSIATMLKVSTKERHALEDIVRWHLRPGYLSNFKRPTQKTIYRYFRDTKDEAVSTLLVSLADQRSTRGVATTEEDQKHHQKICLTLLDKYFVKKKEKPFVPLIGGNDLIRELKLEPSPLFGHILKEVKEKQTLGKLKTKKEALEYAGKIAKRGMR